MFRKYYALVIILGIISLVYAQESLYSQSVNLELRNETLNLGIFADEITVDVLVENEDYVYKFGYFLNLENLIWIKFPFEEQTINGSNWIKGEATKTLTLARSDLNLRESLESTTFILVFACSQDGNGWDCHDNKWINIPLNSTLGPSSCPSDDEWMSYRCPTVQKANNEKFIVHLEGTTSRCLSSAVDENGTSRCIEIDDGCNLWFEEEKESVNAYKSESKVYRDMTITIQEVVHANFNTSSSKCKASFV